MSHLEPTKFLWTTTDGERRKKPAAGTRWKARYRDSAGRARSETFDRKIDAEKFLERVGADLQRGDWIDPALRRVKFEEWAEEWRASGLIHLRPSTARSYQYVLDRRVLPYFSGRAIVAIDRAEVKRFIAKALKEGRSVKTVREYLNVLSLVLQCALEAGAIKANPASRHKLPTRPKPEPVVLNLAQVEAVAAQIRAPYDTLVRLAAQTGLRPGELCGLRVGRVDVLKRRLTVAETVQPIFGELVPGPTKSNSTRVIAMPPSIAAELSKVLARRRDELGRDLRGDDFVFGSLSDDEGPLNRDSFRKWILLPALRRAGLPEEYRTHDLRHTHASMLIELGAHPKAVSDRLGHADIGVTKNVYGHLFPSVEEEIVDRLEELGHRAAAAPWQPAKVVGLHDSGRQDADRTRQDAKQGSV